MKRRFIATLLTFCIVLSMFPMSVYAYDMGEAGGITAISAGDYYSAAIDANGSLWMWGRNNHGQLGTGTTDDSNIPIKVMDGVVSVSCGSGHTAAIKTDRSLWIWGYNSDGQLGNGNTTDSSTPIKILDNIIAVSCGGKHTAAIKSDGSLWVFGSSSHNAVSTSQKAVPTKVMDDVIAVSAGDGFTAVIKEDNTLWTWGTNTYEQLGHSGGSPSRYPTQVMENVIAVSAGTSHCAAIKSDGSLWAWGSYMYGKLGTEDSATIPAIESGVTSISAGCYHTAAIKSDGSLWMWGNNKYGQLGNGGGGSDIYQPPFSPSESEYFQRTPEQISGNISSVSTGAVHTIAMASNGTIWVCGDNNYGQLGTGSTTGSSVPVQIQLQQEPDIPPVPGDGSILALSPANGATNVGYDASNPPVFKITFDREIASSADQEFVADVDLTLEDTFAIYRKSDDTLIYKPGVDSQLRFTLTSDKKTLVVTPLNNHALLNANTEYYVTMGEGFVKFADNSTSPAISKGNWMFKTGPAKAMAVTDGIFKYSSGKTYTYAYDESWFSQNSYYYQHDLTKMSICAAMAAYGTPKTQGDANIKSLMEDLKFNNYYSHYPNKEETSYDSIGYAISSKNIVSDKGEEYTLVFVAVRGGGYGIEWGGDFRVGTDETHEGFALARNKVCLAIRRYFSNYGDEFLPKCKIWIVGYSRGAATTNLVAKELDDGSLAGVDVKPEDVYAFCFECPQNTRAKNVSATKYQNIINIANPIDFVTKVAMASPTLTWGYSRYGKTLYLPYDLGGKNFSELYNQMNAEYYKITGETMKRFPGQSLILDDFMRDLASSIGTPELYTVLNQHAFMEFAAKFLGGGSNLELTKTDVLAVPALGVMLNRHPATTAQVGILYAGGYFDSAHYSELCLAWLNSLDGQLRWFFTPVYRIVYINCPIDVSVYDSEDILVAQICDDTVQEIENGIFAYIDENGQKILALPIDEEYSIKMTATDSGTMTYTVSEYNIDTSSMDKIISYYEVDIETGDNLNGLIENLDNVPSASYPLYVNDSTESLTPSVNQTGEAVQSYTVTASASGNGTITGGGHYGNGEFAKVTATANSGEDFLGWYIGNALISSDAEYRFLVKEDVAITAKFTTNTTSDNPTKPGTSTTPNYGGGSSNSSPTYSITIPNRVTGGTVKAVPTNASEGQRVTLTATPDSGYELSKLIVTDSKGNELKLTAKDDRTYTFTMPNSKATVEAIFTKIWSNPFSDVSGNSWYYDAVKFANENGLMSGIGNGLFTPEANLTRAQFAQILYNKEGKPAVNVGSNFVDVASGTWYTNAVNWAAANGIVSGYGDGRFGPNDNITREQLAVMLWRYAGSPAATNKELNFADADKASGYALNALCWAVENGIINGYGNGQLGPQGLATRAQVAQMLKNYMKR